VLEVEEPAVPLLVVLGEALAELVGEPLLHLVEDDLDSGIHGAGSLLEAGEVVVGREGIQDSESDTRMLAIEDDSREKGKNEARTGGEFGGQLPLGDSFWVTKCLPSSSSACPLVDASQRSTNATHSRHLHGPFPVWARHTHTGDFGPSGTSRPRRS